MRIPALWLRHQPVLGEDSRPGDHDGPVDRIGRVVPGLKPRDLRLVSLGHHLGCVLAGTAGRVLAPLGRDARAGVDRASGRLRQQMRPGPGDNVKHVTASSGQEPAGAGHLVGQGVDRGVRDPLRVDRQPQAASGSSQWLSQPCWLTRICGRNARSSGGTTASKARSPRRLG